MYQFDSAALNDLARVWQAAPSQVQPLIETWLRSIQMHLEGEVKERTPKKTGLLQNSIAAEPLQYDELGVTAVIGAAGLTTVPTKAQVESGYIGTSLIYAIPVELGTKPRLIQSKGKKALNFVGPRRHPGTKGKFMFSRTFDANVGQIQSDLNDLVRDIGMQLGVL